MVYKTFLENIQASVQKELGEGAQVNLQQVLKNNGILLDGLSISSASSGFSPTIYLNAYYEEAENGLPLSVIAEQIVLMYEEQAFSPHELLLELKNFDDIKDKIVFKLLGTQDNELLLSGIPCYDFLDLSVVFYLILSEDVNGQMTSLIHNEHLELWNITKKELLKLAEHNTPLLLPPRILPIEDALTEIGGPEGGCIIFPDQPPVSLYVLTSRNGINGAACLLYKNILKNFAESMKDDLIILPSSIHEVLLTPCKCAFPCQELNEMVSLINHSDVPIEDRLSNHVYFYSRKQDCITIPSNSSAPSGKANPQ